MGVRGCLRLLGASCIAWRLLYLQSVGSADFRKYLTIEERQEVRRKVREAYAKSCTSFDELLDTLVAIDEELLYVAAPSRLDYFKSGFEFENRVVLKRKQLARAANAATGGSASSSSSSSAAPSSAAGANQSEEPTKKQRR